MPEGTISIIVPIYNSEKDLDQCIESIVNQTYKNLEIILVNDGSTDNSINVCKKWKSNDSRIILIDKQNEGVAKARNDGLKRATGDYIGFVDHDDFIDPKMYETMLKDMQEHNVDIVMCSSTGVYEDGTTTKAYPSYKSFVIDKENLIKRMQNYEKIFCSSVWSKLYKKEVVGNLMFDTEIILGDDYYFNGIAYTNIDKLYYDERSLYNYRIREGSISRRKVDKHFFDKYLVMDKLSDYYEKNNIGKSEDFDEMRFGISYEILYGLYVYGGDRKTKKEWQKIFKSNSKKYNARRFKDRVKIFMMNHLTSVYVRLTK